MLEGSNVERHLDLVQAGCGRIIALVASGAWLLLKHENVVHVLRK